MFSSATRSLKLNSVNPIKNSYFYQTTFRTYLGIPSKRRESVFNQNKFNPYYIESKRNDKLKKNPITQAKFEDENYKWETIPSPVKEEGKKLLALLNREELAKLKKSSPNRDPIRLGDKIEVEYYHSISSKKLYKYKGVVVGSKRPNSHTYNFKYLTMVSGSYVLLTYPYYSPMIASIKVVTPSNIHPEIKRSKMFNLSQIKDFGQNLIEIMKGGKKTNLTKKSKQQLKKIESQKENIVIE